MEKDKRFDMVWDDWLDWTDEEIGMFIRRAVSAIDPQRNLKWGMIGNQKK